MFLPKYRLPVRVPPLWAESLRGYLMRVAEHNGLSGSDRLMADALGGARLPITVQRAVVLADYCRCDVTEFFQLFGIEHRSSEANRQWQLAGEWITKDYFIRAGRPAICPACLRDEPYLRGQWELSFYVACPRHGWLLLDHCPACRRALSPHRMHLEKCNCGYALQAAETAPAPAATLWVADMIDCKVMDGPSRHRTPHSENLARSVDRLASLSLDTLCKTLWLLGHCFAADEPLQTGHGRQRARVEMAQGIISTALEILSDWPSSFIEGLEHRLRELDPLARQHPEAFLAPIWRYLEREVAEEEGAFLFAAYDRFVRDAWKSRNYATYRQKSIRQMELF